MPNYVDPKILLWNPKLLWSQYLQIRDEWAADQEKGDIEIEWFGSPEQLGVFMEMIAKDRNREYSKWMWETLFVFGYATLKRYYQWDQERLQKDLDTAASGREELGDYDPDDEGFTFTGSIPPD